MLATVHIVELLLGDRVVDVDGSEEDLTLVSHLVQSGNTGGGLFGNTDEFLAHFSPFLSKASLESVSDDSEDLLELGIASAVRVWELTSLGEVSLGLDTFVDEKSGITSIINENIWSITFWPRKHSIGAIPVLLESLALPGEHIGGLSLNDGSCCVILSREDVARSPSNFSTESLESLNENTGLNSHVK